MIVPTPHPTHQWRPAVAQPMPFTKAKRPADIEEIEALAAKLEPALAKTIFTALQSQKDAVDLDALADAIKAGRIDEALQLLGIQNVAEAVAGVSTALQNATFAGGALAASQIAERMSGVTFAFDQLNPRLITWLQTYSLDLIRQIDQTTKEGIRGALVNGMNLGQNPRDTARQVRAVIGLTDKQAKAVQNFRRELETFHNRRSAGGYGIGSTIDRVNGSQVLRPDADGLPKDGITERRLRDFRYDGQLNRAMSTGKPLTPAQIDKMVDAYSRKYLKYRSQTIARTEAIRTTNFGVQDAWRQAIEKGKVPEHLVRRTWIVAHDERLCEICSPIPRLNKGGVKFGQPFQTPDGPQFLPPMHPNCRCTVYIRRFEPSQLKENS